MIFEEWLKKFRAENPYHCCSDNSLKIGWEGHESQTEIEPANARNDLFELMAQEYNLPLIESQLDSIIYCVLNALELDVVGGVNCTKKHFYSKKESRLKITGANKK